MQSESPEVQPEVDEIVKSQPEAEPKPSPSGSERFRNISLGIAGVVSSVLIPILGLYYTSRDKDREVSKGFVEIATKILSDAPTKDNQALRMWAISLIDNYSAVRLPDAARTALLNEQSLFGSDKGRATLSRATLHRIQDAGFTLGVSVSHFDHSVDFKALKEGEVQFVYIKATQGASGVDPVGSDYAKLASQSGLKVGLYHFVTFAGDIDAQFANFAARLDAIEWNLPPMLDCEQDASGGQVPSDYAARIDRFATKLVDRFRVKPIIYTGAILANEHLDERVSKYPLAIAQYGKEPTVPKWWTDYLFWDVAQGVSDNPALRAYEILTFKGSLEELGALGAGRK
jgi:lysozyme